VHFSRGGRAVAPAPPAPPPTAGCLWVRRRRESGAEGPCGEASPAPGGIAPQLIPARAVTANTKRANRAVWVPPRVVHDERSGDGGCCR
jgi:hypothetical protein